MGKPSCTDDEFIRLIKDVGPAKTARQLGITQRVVYARRRSIEERRGASIASPNNRSQRVEVQHPHRAQLHIQNGTVLVGSDIHRWPGPLSTAQRAFLRYVKELKPKAIVLNGDVLDFASISRHPPIGWENLPDVADEIEAAKDYLHKLELAAGRGVRKIWTLGNHDARFETKLAQLAPQYAKVHGVHLSDHFPQWEPAWSCWINDNTVIKHRFKGGVHATHNNTMTAGKTMVTGHLHSAKVTPYTDYNGTRWGVDTGCLADPDHAAFVDYTEDAPKNWRSAFCVLTFKNSQLLPPELVMMWDKDSVTFRGEIVRV